MLIETMEIIKYPHPTLRRPSRPLRRVDADLRRIVARMFELMYEAKGVGLAANQVDLPYRFFVINLSGDPEISEEAQVIINPVLSQPKGHAEAEEGCLSLPDLYAQVTRPEHILLDGFSLNGEEVRGELTGMAARVIQHETDHLDGKLFIDRLSPTGAIEIKDKLRDFESQFERQRHRGEIPGDEQIGQRLMELERART